jgi:hypothetical protein
VPLTGQPDVGYLYPGAIREGRYCYDMSTYEIFMVILTIAILVVEIIKLVSKDNKK